MEKKGAFAMENSTQRWLVGILLGAVSVLLTVIGLLAGHVTTVGAMLEHQEMERKDMQARYVPRTELDHRLRSIDSKLDQVIRETREARAANGG